MLWQRLSCGISHAETLYSLYEVRQWHIQSPRTATFYLFSQPFWQILSRELAAGSLSPCSSWLVTHWSKAGLSQDSTRMGDLLEKTKVPVCVSPSSPGQWHHPLNQVLNCGPDWSRWMLCIGKLYSGGRRPPSIRSVFSKINGLKVLQIESL